ATRFPSVALPFETQASAQVVAGLALALALSDPARRHARPALLLFVVLWPLASSGRDPPRNGLSVLEQNRLLMTACEPGAQPLEERGIPAALQLRFLIRPAQPVSWGGAGIKETAS